MPATLAPYIGRFAPSPTGPLHLGSLCSALASYLDARSNGGRWLLRIENLDPPREQVGADHRIIQSLRAHRLLWDGDIVWQSQRLGAYQQALEQLLDQQQAFYCSCSRAQLAEHGGLHRDHCVAPLQKGDAAVRLRASNQPYCFRDRLLGHQQQTPSSGGDVVLRRRDGLFAYQLAVVVDDADSEVSDIVRGSDLLDSTAWQLQLQDSLGYPRPNYLHLPLLTDSSGDKLSKRSYAPALDDSCAEDNIRRVLRYLNQATPPTTSDLDSLLRWAAAHWQVSAIPRHAIAVN
ncbi:tRNA glutamyl-Q(34) synthetase GluQRS [Spongiibacter sp.]|uniref:tRNA glutamyl-Q(34) synthetase GluQRS n=1 Tax=Spongiibacter sp. TaxID=2024860 RepID=UPI00356413B8